MVETKPKDFYAIRDLVAERGKAYVITVGNQKGGVGKTANATLIGYNLAKNGLKTLIIDLDPQANATGTLMNTRRRYEIEEGVELPAIDESNDKTLMLGIAEHNIADLPVNVIPNLDVIRNARDFSDFERYAIMHTKTEQESYLILKPLIDSLKPNYDVILLDMPPQIKITTNNALFASDFVLISMQTQHDSYIGAVRYLKTVAEIAYIKDKIITRDEGNELYVLGILATLIDKRNTVDQTVLKDTNDIAKGILFDIKIPNMARVKRFPQAGIGVRNSSGMIDHYDVKAVQEFNSAAGEMCKRIKKYETDGGL